MYYNNIARRDLEYPPGLFEAESYHSLISDNSSNEPDDRVSAIEIALDKPLPIEHHVVAVGLPERLADDPLTGQMIKALGADVVTYEYIRGHKPDATLVRLYDTIRAYYKDKGWLKKTSF